MHRCIVLDKLYITLTKLLIILSGYYDSHLRAGKLANYSPISYEYRSVAEFLYL